jgi:hypothetical protein
MVRDTTPEGDPPSLVTVSMWSMLLIGALSPKAGVNCAVR